MAVMEGIDLEIQSWFVDPSEVEFCRRPDGSDWLLGEGSYGKVGRVDSEWAHPQQRECSVMFHTQQRQRQCVIVAIFSSQSVAEA